MHKNCTYLFPIAVLLSGLFLTGCQKEKEPIDKRIKQLDPKTTVEMARSIETAVPAELDEDFTLKIWGVDSLVADPVSIDIDDQGKLYYTRTNRQKNVEFDIRGHQDWEIESIHLQDVEDKRAFLHNTLSPENSKKNEWLADLNGDGSHDWKDMLVDKEHVYRLEDTNGDGVADLSQLMIDDFNEEVTDAMGGILKHGDDLFVNIAPDMWRFKDKDGDGIAEEKTSISHGYGVHVGFGGHGMSGIEVGPEGKIYWQIGDIGFNGKGPDGQKWEHPNSGVIVRSNPDGSDFEVFSYGNRNTHEFVFDEYGNLISEDNDGDHPGESERIVYVVNGADIGWRINWQFGKYRDPDNNTYKVWMDEKMYIPRWEGQAAYIIPTIKNFVNGPTGMLYNPGTALNKKYKNTFFIGEFVGNPTRSGIHAFKLNPKGATFELGEYKSIMKGVLATGIDFGPDGAMYLADWIEGWDIKKHGRVWKMDVKDIDAQERALTKSLLEADVTKQDNAKLSEWLKNADMRVRHKAQFELATRGDEGIKVFQENVTQTQHQLARVHAIWGISQFARKDMKHAKLFLPLLKDSDPEIRAQAAKWIGDVRFKEAGEALIPLLKDEYARARFFAAEALGRIAYEPGIQPVIEMLRANNEEDTYLRHAGSLALARIAKPAPVVALAKDESRAVRIAAVVALRRMRDKGIAEFLTDNDEFIVTEAARGINDDLSIPDALPALGEVLNDYRFKNEALLRRAISANLRVGSDKTMQNLISYAAHEGAPVAMRTEAMAALSTWAKPSVLDRVDGRYRGEVKRDLAPVQSKSGEVLTHLLTNKEAAVRLAAAKAIGKLKIEKASATLLARLKTDPKPEVRAEALKSLAATGNKQIDVAIKQALSDNEKSVRVIGLDLLAKMDLSRELMVTLLADVINTRTTEEKQAAITTLGTLPLSATQKTFEQLLDKLSAGKLPTEVQLELSDAIDSTHSAPLMARLKEVSAKIAKASPDSLMAAYSGALLGGDSQKGARIFFGHQTAQCIRCHSYDDFGGSAGPRLNGVAKRLTRYQLLQALVEPSARIAPGFGTVTLELKNGKKVSGILQGEKANGLVLKIGDKPDTTVSTADVAKRINSPSSMPEMRYLLTKKEIRDLVSFLVTLEEEK